MVRVHLQDGTAYIGRVVYYDAHILPAERELILGPPLFWKEKEEADFSLFPADEDWVRVAISAPCIDAMWVRYAPKGPREDV